MKEIAQIYQDDIENLSKCLQNTALGVHVIDEEGQIVWANDAQLNTLGYSSEEFIGHNIVEFYRSNDITDIIDRLKNKENIENSHINILGKGDQIIPIILSSNKYEIDGEFVHTRCFATNINTCVTCSVENDKIEDLRYKLEKSKQKYKDLIDATETGYVILDMNYQVEDANERYVKMFGFNGIDEIIGYNLRDCLNKENVEIFDESFEKVKAGKVVVDLELDLTNKKKEYVAIRMHANLIENGTSRFFCLVRDISEKKIAEKQREKSQEIKRKEIRKDLISLKKCLS